MSHENNVIERSAHVVRLQDRVLDVVALLTLTSGLLLFGFGRAELKALANQTYSAPPAGVSWVSRAELHDSQTRWGALIAGAGLILSVGAAMKHASARRRLL